MSAVPPANGVNARAVACAVVARVLSEGRTLDVALQEALAPLPAGVAAAVRSLSYGAVRGYHRHEAVLARLLTQPVRKIEPALRALLSVALFELEDARTPQYAVVDAAVSTAREVTRAGAAGLVNAVLRRYLREHAAVAAWVAGNPAIRHAAPAWLAARLRSDWPRRWTQLLAASDVQAPLWLRVDCRRAGVEEYLEQLRAAGIGARAAPQVPHAVVLDTPCDVQQLPGFATGLVSVQDVGAQCVVFPLELAPGLRVLDACAAPGGKTALIAERAPALARLVAVDVDSTRLQRVRENLQRGELSAQLLVADATAPATWWDGEPFDRILLDAPCSALGVIRRHPDIRLRRSAADLIKLPELQMRLLMALWPLLAPGGRLVYATCTVTRSENRDLVAAFLQRAPDALCVPSEQWAGWPQLGEADPCGRQILPGEAGADGFYYAALVKQ